MTFRPLTPSVKTVLGLFLLSSCATSPSGSHRPHVDASLDPGAPRVVVLHFSDLHGRLRGTANGGGYARVAAYVKQAIREAGPKTDVLVTYGGDLVGKSALPCRKTKESACAPLLSKMAPGSKVYAVLGNHEIDREARELAALIESTGAHWLATNVSGHGSSHAFTGISWEGPRSGAKWLLYGWTTGRAGRGLRVRETPSSEQLGEWSRQAEATRRPALWLTHQEWPQDEAFAKQLCERPEIRSLAILKGNDHATRQETSSCLKVFEPGAFGENVTRLEFVQDSADPLGWRLARETLVVLGKDAPEDPELKSEIDALYATHAPEATEVLGSAIGDRDLPGVADLVADIYRTVTHADVAIVNRGAVKGPLAAGPVTRDDWAVIVPYNNDIHGLDWAVKDLEASLCQAAARGRDPAQDHGSELHLSGARLVNAGEPGCRLETSRRGSVKVAVDNYVVGRSARWLGKSLQGRTFRFQVTAEQALNRYLKMKGQKL